MKEPMSPSECYKWKTHSLPESVIEAVNNLLSSKFNGVNATLLQSDIVNEILRLDKTITKDAIFFKHMLDFEPLFEKKGWNVVYDKPAYCDAPYEPRFNFTPKKKL